MSSPFRTHVIQAFATIALIGVLYWFSYYDPPYWMQIVVASLIAAVAFFAHIRAQARHEQKSFQFCPHCGAELSSWEKGPDDEPIKTCPVEIGCSGPGVYTRSDLLRTQPPSRLSRFISTRFGSL